MLRSVRCSPGRQGLCVALLAGLLAAFAAPAASEAATAGNQLSDAEAAGQTILAYLAQYAGPANVVTGGNGVASVTYSTDNWNPTAGVTLSGIAPNFVVAADGSGDFTTVQAAVSAAANQAGTRVYIGIKPGIYRETVVQNAASLPITLYGLGSDASQVVITGNHANPMNNPETSPVTCGGAVTYGTSGSATVTIKANGFQAKNLTIQNDYVRGTCSVSSYSNQSAVALYLTGDQAVLDSVTILGHQDTLSLGSSSAVYRSYFKNSKIVGDTDFIFGPGVAVFDGCTIEYTADNLGPATNVGMNFAPSQIVNNLYGFLVINSTLTASSAAPLQSLYLARAWDQSVASLASYINGVSPNGRLVIRNSQIGPHINAAAPYAASTIGRPFYISATCRIGSAATIDHCAPVAPQAQSPNLLFEYNNTWLAQ